MPMPPLRLVGASCIFLRLARSHVEIPLLTREEFEVYPLNLDLSNVFCEKGVAYTYEQYLAHLEDTDPVSQRIILGIR